MLLWGMSEMNVMWLKLVEELKDVQTEMNISSSRTEAARTIKLHTQLEELTSPTQREMKIRSISKSRRSLSFSEKEEQSYLDNKNPKKILEQTITYLGRKGSPIRVFGVVVTSVTVYSTISAFTVFATGLFGTYLSNKF